MEIINEKAPGAGNAEGQASITDAGSLAPDGLRASLPIGRSQPSAEGMKAAAAELAGIEKSADPAWLAAARAAILTEARERGPVTLDEALARQGVPPPKQARWRCPVTRPLISAGRLSIVGAIRGESAAARGGLHREYVAGVTP